MNTMKRMTLNYYQDPGHGWVKIGLQTLVDLGIHDKISSYSYVRLNHAYLEEDCDLGLLFKVCDAKGTKISLRDRHTNKQSKIRSYQNYKQYNTAHNALLNLWNS